MARQTLHVNRLSPSDQRQVDQWFTTALVDPTVNPFLGMTYTNTPFRVPASDAEGVMLMSSEEASLLNMTFDRDLGCAHIDIWMHDVSKRFNNPTDAKKIITNRLFDYAITTLPRYPFIETVSSSTKLTNTWMVNFYTSKYGASWGIEPGAARDYTMGDGLVDVVHFKDTYVSVVARIEAGKTK